MGYISEMKRMEECAEHLRRKVTKEHRPLEDYYPVDNLPPEAKRLKEYLERLFSP